MHRDRRFSPTCLVFLAACEEACFYEVSLWLVFLCFLSSPVCGPSKVEIYPPFDLQRCTTDVSKSCSLYTFLSRLHLRLSRKINVEKELADDGVTRADVFSLRACWSLFPLCVSDFCLRCVRGNTIRHAHTHTHTEHDLVHFSDWLPARRRPTT